MLNVSDDDDFSAPTTRSTLAVLFSSPKLQNASLVYNAPKQPAKQKDNKMSSLLCAKIVNVIEGMSDGGPVAGKYGIAIIGNEHLKVYEIILYKTREHVLTRAKLSPTFNFSLQDYVIGVFYNNKKCRWVIQFQDEKDASEFCDKLKSCGAGITKTNTDSPSLTPHGDSNRQSPPILSQSSSASIENPFTIVKDSSTSIDNLTLDYNPSVMVENLPSLVQNSAINVVADKSLHYTESDATKSSQLTSRIAKMGLPVLPRSSIVAPAENGNKSEMHIEEGKSKNEEKPSTINDIVTASRQTDLYQKESELLQNQYIQNVHFTHSQILAVPDPLSTLATETRISSCETKLNLCQIQSKLDILLNSIQKQPSQTFTTDDSLSSRNKVLELKIENLQREIEQLRLENKTLTENSEKANDCKEHVDMLEKENKTLRSKVLNFELEMINLRKEVEIAREEKKNTYRLLEQNQILLQDNVKLQNRLKDYETKLEEFNKLKASVLDLNKRLVEKEEELSRCKSELDNRSEPSSKEKAEYLKTLESQIKDIMNMMYQTIVNAGSGTHPPISDDFKPVLVKHVKSSTFRIIEEVQKKFGQDNL